MSLKARCGSQNTVASIYDCQTATTRIRATSTRTATRTWIGIAATWWISVHTIILTSYDSGMKNWRHVNWKLTDCETCFNIETNNNYKWMILYKCWRNMPVWIKVKMNKIHCNSNHHMFMILAACNNWMKWLMNANANCTNLGQNLVLSNNMIMWMCLTKFKQLEKSMIIIKSIHTIHRLWWFQAVSTWLNR